MFQLMDVSSMQSAYLSTAFFSALLYDYFSNHCRFLWLRKHQQKEKSRDDRNIFLCELTEAMTVASLTSSETEESLILNSVLLELHHVRQ